MTEKKDFKIEFAPGCFDSFDGTQEELDQMVAEIQSMFAGKTRDEIEAMGKPLDEEEWEDLSDEVKEQLFRSLSDDNKRNLQ